MAIAVVSATESNFTADATDHTVTMPATVSTGDLLLMLWTNDGNATVTTPGGWSQVYTAIPETSVRQSVYKKISDGTEGGTTVNFVTSATEKACAIVYRISGATGEVAFGTAIQDNAVNLDPPSVTAPWGSKNNLWMIVVSSSTTAVIDPLNYPTGYLDNINAVSTGTTTGTDAQIHGSWRIAVGETENPGTFNEGQANAVQNTIAVEPAATGSPGAGTGRLKSSGLVRPTFGRGAA